MCRFLGSTGERYLFSIEVMKGLKISNGESQVDLAINMAATQELLGLTSRGAGIRGLY